ncbi:MAG: FAD-dependent oxidoreductase [Pseudomonadota bacterium]
MAKSLPTQARVVIIGGGIIGCSVAYHLAKLGWSDTILLERRQLTCGTTWHAAGLVNSMRGTENATKLAKYTIDLFRGLEEETGQPTGLKTVGTIQIASDEARLEEMRRSCDLAARFGIPTRELSPGEIKEMWPLANVDDIIQGFFFPEDGRVNPTDTATALAKGARSGGAQIFENVTVNDVIIKDKRVVGVDTDQGVVNCDIVVNCTGMWARDFAAKSGVKVPLQAAEHYYLITEEMEGVHGKLPVMRDPARYSYYREETGKLMIGYFEPKGRAWGLDGIPKDFCFDELEGDMEAMLPIIEGSMKRVPASENAGIKLFFCGPESFTPDRSYVMGHAPTVENYYVAAGFNSLGILSSGGAGMVMAHQIVNGHPPMDIFDVDIRRCHDFQVNPNYLRDRTVETLGLPYREHWPFLQRETARNVKKSVLHDRIAAQGACFGETAGWERPNWYAPKGVTPEYKYSYGRQNWFEYSAEEHRAVRENVGLFDQSSFSKFLVQGKDATRVLNRIATSDVDVPVGKVVYTQFLNEQGRIEADPTITRLSEDSYMVLTGPVTYTHVFYWIKNNIPDDAHCFITDLTDAMGFLNIQGPNARALLNTVTDADLSSEAFPFGTMQEIHIGYQTVKALRLTYMGELGWELYIPTPFMQPVYDTLVDAGKKFDLRHCGYHALQSLRMEKAYREWGHDISTDENSYEAGLGFALDFKKDGGFIGRDKALEYKEQKPRNKRLVQFLLNDPEPMLYHDELIVIDGEINSHIHSAMYGHTLGGSVALGYVHHEEGVTADWLASRKVEIRVAGRDYPATASLKALYDPKNERVKV